MGFDKKTVINLHETIVIVNFIYNLRNYKLINTITIAYEKVHATRVCIVSSTYL